MGGVEEPIPPCWRHAYGTAGQSRSTTAGLPDGVLRLRYTPLRMTPIVGRAWLTHPPAATIPLRLFGPHAPKEDSIRSPRRGG